MAHPLVGGASSQRGNTQRERRPAGVTQGAAAELESRTREQGAENAMLKIQNDALKKRIETLEEKLATEQNKDGNVAGNMQALNQKELNEGQRASISAYVSGLYKRLKFLNNETITAYPKVLQKALSQLVMLGTNETQMNYKTATLKEMRYQLSQKRQYSKKQIMKKYIGK